MTTFTFPPTRFLTSAAQLSQLPPDKGAEVAFIGRSNSGKSTAINAITGIKGLARASKTPGRTQLLNFFQITEEQRLVDLPGYGFARVHDQRKEEWEVVISDYLQTRHSLKGLIITMDSRHPLKERDESMLTWAANYQIPVYILLTKADKLTRQQSLKVLKETQQRLITLNNSSIVQLFSATKGTGLETAQRTILNWLQHK
ncbi:ribosome biogenesis GTP-binding protein YihA/YsxC [Rickettsiella endosymbiont of Dermanyssus gallinae]|uniref:ribosome biogenesis GTP-binding protein YihA/YsxC n=1 Tax=Rickettsiella endosymbiont of Dermanyssus gallinae TaxID=2856608 RepID=UPI001C52D9C8|nr:ribosome biogenesis GTP-binding protein YihA/YsxC [Rickettsiella endosymbiont of Dermanyssus gallinae]